MKKLLVCILILSFIFPSCIRDDEGPDPEVVARGLEIRLTSFRERQIKHCREEALEKAAVIADSLIAEMAFRLKDTLVRPDRLPKPAKPDFTSPPDSLQPKPILKRDPGR